MDKKTKKSMNTEEEKTIDVDDKVVKKYAENELYRLTVTICILIVISYVLGYFQTSFLVPIVLCGYALWVWKIKTNRIHDWFFNEHEMREHRRRALNQSETVEWLNYLLNRWWYFSDQTINDILKRSLDPVLESCKPKMIDNIELTKFTLGHRTPYLKYLRVFDMSDDLRKLLASEVTYRNPPKDLPVRPKYQVVLEADMGLDAPESQMIIQLKLNSRMGDTDVVIEKFKIRGQIQLVLMFNQNIPFPHLAAFSISFLNPPKVDFEIRLLKKIQLMEFPLIRAWIAELVNDSLKISLVDPGHVTVPLCNDPELMGRQSGYASGVLTITLKGGMHGKATSDEQWCTVTLDKQKIRTKEITSDVLWQEQVSLVVRSLQFDKLRIKIKGKRRFGPNYTVVEYVLPLVRMNLEQNSEQKLDLQDDNIEGSTLQLLLNYSDLPLLDISNETDEETFHAQYLEKNAQEEPDELCGMLYVRVHKGINLIPMDSSGTSDPYVMIFSNKELVQVGQVVEESLNPEWDTMIEFFTLDYTQTTLSFIVHDRNPMVLPNVLLADDNDDFMGSCNFPLSKPDWCTFKKELDLLFKFKGDLKKGRQECLKKVGKIVVSVIFRPISSIKASVRPTVNQGMNEGEPLHQKRNKIDSVTMEAILQSERGSLTICILRARNLVACDLNGRSDPFVIVRVGDAKQEKYKTKIVYRTLNPVWNEQVTLAMPQKHQRISIEVWDKDPFRQEKMGVVRFHFDDLISLGEGGLTDKHWFDLEQAKSGELQLAFKTVLPDEDKSQGLQVVTEGGELVNSFSYGSDNSEEYLVLNESPVDTIDKRNKKSSVGNRNKLLKTQSMQVDHTSLSPEIQPPQKSKSVDLTSLNEEDEELAVSPEQADDHVDFSGEPSKYFGINGKILEVTGLYVHEDIDEVYVKAKLDRHAKFEQPARRSILNRSDRILCRTTNLKVEKKIIVDESFQTKSDVGVSPCLYLVLEVKSDKKGKDVIDSRSMLLRNFFRGQNPVTRVIELDNGGKMKLMLHHVVEEDNNNIFRKRFRRFSSAPKVYI